MGTFDVVYPPNGRLNFDGGLNTKFEKSLIQDNESPDCFNVVFTNGSVATREGHSKLNTTAIGSFVGDGIYTRRVDTGAETMVVFAGGSMWTLGGASTFSTVASAQSVWTAGVRVATTQYENHMFIGNGYIVPYKYNGTNFTRHGVYEPTNTVSAASVGAAGGFTGSYSYKVSYVNSSAVQGDVSSGAITISLAGAASVSLTSIPVAPTSFGVNSRKIYRTAAGGAAYKLVTTIADNTTTTYSDTTADASLGVAAPTDQGVPPYYDTCVTFADRIFCNDANNPNYVWYSNIGEPYTFPQASNFLKIGDATSDIVKGLFVYDNSVIILCENSVFKIVMPDPDDAFWTIVRLRSSYGSKSPFAPFYYNNKMMFAAMQNSKVVGFAAISGDTLDPQVSVLDMSKQASDLKSDKIETDIYDIQEGYVRNISSMVFQNKAYISVTDGSGSTTNNRVYIADFSLSRIKEQELTWAPISGVPAAQFTVYDSKLYFVSSTANGFVYRLQDTTYIDNSGAIDSYFWTKEYSGLKGHENLQKDFRKVSILVDKAGSYYMSMRARVDSDSGVGQEFLIDLTPGSMLWGTGMWGLGVWGSGYQQEDKTVFLGSMTGKRIQFKFTNRNTSSQRFKVHGLKFTYNIKGRR
jgi:hypothetical protein